MEKMDMQTPNLADKNYEILSKMFPNAITETIDADGKVVRAIDADVLRQEISCSVVEGNDERYQFTWPDKKKAALLSSSPITLTLRPDRNNSVNFDSTENIYIEGDNLDALKLLQETYLGKVKMIYIDPPYNTGNDFLYEDDFAETVDEYMERSGQYDYDGNRLTRNLDSNGRFHTDWLNLMYSRLKLARNLLSEEGIIFISIDDGELFNLKKICDEIFGADNFIANFIWEKRKTRENRKAISVRHDYILCYTKNYDNRSLALGLEEMNSEAIDRYKNPDNDPRGVWTSVPAIAQGGHGTKNQFYTFVSPNGKEFIPPSGSCWRYTWPKMQEAIADNRIWFGENGNNVPRIKKFLNEGKQGLTPESLLSADKVGTNDSAKRELVGLFDGVAVFETPKPVSLLQHLISIVENGREGIYMDFFSGTATFAEAIINQNLKDGGKRKFILVQLGEAIEENSEAAKKGYKKITDIGKDRIRRVGEKISEEQVDIGYRTLKIDSSNMKDVYYNPAEVQQSLFDLYADNIKEDRTPEDLLFQVMLDLGVLLSSKIEETEIAGKKVFSVADGFLIACFDKDVTEETVKAVAEQKPYYAVFRDSSMANDSVATNFDQIFEAISPDTVRKVL